MKEVKWLDGNRIQVEPPKRTKKCTGTRFASILGQNVWSTPFQMWCEITKTYEEPFEGSIYTEAGKKIEPKQADYMERMYGMDIVRPTDVYGADPFKTTFGDFFRDVKRYGGMWDFLAKNEDGNVDTVLEMKTTKRAEDWSNDIPEYYALQAALYAYLLGVDNVIMVASFLEDKDYEHPENFKPNVSNTAPFEFKVSERYPNFAQLVAQVNQWWEDHVETGISPEYDEQKDADYLKALRTHSLSPEDDISEKIAEAETLKAEIDSVEATLKDKEKRLKELQDLIKKHAMEQFRDGDKKVEIKGSTYTFTISRSATESVDKDALKADGLYEKYLKTTETYKLTVK